MLEETELYQLKSQVDIFKEAGQDLLAEMARHLDEQISEAQENLQKLKDKLGVQK